MRCRFMRVSVFTLAAVAVLTLSFAGCKSEPTRPPNPVTVIDNVRDQLTPFRFTLATDPASPNYNAPILLKVHIIDAANQPADGVTVKVDVSMSGMDHGAQHLTLSGKGSGDKDKGAEEREECQTENSFHTSPNNSSRV